MLGKNQPTCRRMNVWCVSENCCTWTSNHRHSRTLSLRREHSTQQNATWFCSSPLQLLEWKRVSKQSYTLFASLVNDIVSSTWALQGKSNGSVWSIWSNPLKASLAAFSPTCRAVRVDGIFISRSISVDRSRNARLCTSECCVVGRQ